MAKKNFDDFINAAGKKPKPTPEEVEAMAKQLHNAAAPTVVVADAAKPPVTAESSEVKKGRDSERPAVKQKPALAPKRQALNRQQTAASREAPAEAPKEKVRITIDLAKDLYKRMKLAVVENETEISAYIRHLIETDLSRK